MSTLRLQGVGPLLALLPYEFGYHPSGSVVVTLMCADQVCGAVRFDEHLVREDDVHHVRDEVLHASARIDVTAVVVTAYRCAPDLDLSLVVDTLLPAFAVEHALVVAQDVWWASRCVPACCDGALAPLPRAAQVAALAPIVARRREPACSRDAATAVFRRDDAMGRGAVTALLDAGRGSFEDVETAWAYLVEDSDTSDATRVRPALAMVAGAMRDPFLRDEMVWSVVPELAAAGDVARPRWCAPAASSRLIALLPTVPTPARAHWLCLVALALWREGERPVAALAAMEAHAVAPRVPLVDLVVRMTNLGMTYAQFAQRPVPACPAPE